MTPEQAHQAAAEITALVKEEAAGRVLGTTDTEITIRFKDVASAASWVSTYATDDAARFHATGTSFAQPVTVILTLASYDLY